jgi:hypothetical protein
MQRLDETYRKLLRPHVDSDGSRNAAWESYCFELGGVFSELFPDWEPSTSFFQNLSRVYDRYGPMVTSSYIEDLSSLWTEVHPALLEVKAQKTRFLGVDPGMCRLLDGSNRSSITGQIIIARRHCTTPLSHSGATHASCSVRRVVSANNGYPQPRVPTA